MDDILAPGIDLLIVGFNPGTRSGATGNHYAGRGNQFWRLLHDSGLTPRLLDPAECRDLLRHGIGSTNLVARTTASAAELSRAELRAGVPGLAAIVAETRPRAIGYTGKGVYLAASGRARAEWGRQAMPLFPPAVDFVLPSPSGLARMRFAEKLAPYRALAQHLGRAPVAGSEG